MNLINYIIYVYDYIDSSVIIYPTINGNKDNPIF